MITNEVNAMYCGNRKVFDGILISSLSMAKTTKANLNIYILTMDLTNQNKEYMPIRDKEAKFIEKILKKYNENNRVILIDATETYIKAMGENVNKETGYTPYTFLRLVTDKIESLPEKIAYLDADTIVARDIQELYGIDVDDYEFAAVLDYLGSFFIKSDYFNAGVMLLNMKKLRETNLFSKCIEMCNTKKMAFPDQTALNRLSKRVLYIPRKFNEQKSYSDDTIVQHFSKSIRLIPSFHTVNVKPWEVEKVKSVLKLYVYDDLLLEYQKYMREFKEEK